MHWPIVAAVALAIGSYQFGAMSVWITVLSITLKIILLALAVLVLGVVVLFLWRRSRESDQA